MAQSNGRVSELSQAERVSLLEATIRRRDAELKMFHEQNRLTVLTMELEKASVEEAQLKHVIQKFKYAEKLKAEKAEVIETWHKETSEQMEKLHTNISVSREESQRVKDKNAAVIKKKTKKQAAQERKQQDADRKEIEQNAELVKLQGRETAEMLKKDREDLEKKIEKLQKSKAKLVKARHLERDEEAMQLQAEQVELNGVVAERRALLFTLKASWEAHVASKLQVGKDRYDSDVEEALRREQECKEESARLELEAARIEELMAAQRVKLDKLSSKLDTKKGKANTEALRLARGEAKQRVQEAEARAREISTFQPYTKEMLGVSKDGTWEFQNGKQVWVPKIVGNPPNRPSSAPPHSSPSPMSKPRPKGSPLDQLQARLRGAPKLQFAALQTTSSPSSPKAATPPSRPASGVSSPIPPPGPSSADYGHYGGPNSRTAAPPVRPSSAPPARNDPSPMPMPPKDPLKMLRNWKDSPEAQKYAKQEQEKEEEEKAKEEEEAGEMEVSSHHSSSPLPSVDFERTPRSDINMPAASEMSLSGSHMQAHGAAGIDDAERVESALGMEYEKALQEELVRMDAEITIQKEAALAEAAEHPVREAQRLRAAHTELTDLEEADEEADEEEHEEQEEEVEQEKREEAPAEPEITASPEAPADLATYMASASRKQSTPRAQASGPPPALANGMAAPAAVQPQVLPEVVKSASQTQAVAGTRRRMTNAAEETMAAEVDKKKKKSMFTFGSKKESNKGNSPGEGGTEKKKKKGLMGKLFG